MAQRVQFPTVMPEANPYYGPAVATPRAPAFSAQAPTWDPYAGGGSTVVPSGAPYAAPAQPSTGFVGQATRFLQEIDFDNTYLAPLRSVRNGNALGVNDDEVSATFAIPIFASPFLVTPGFAAHFWDGPNSTMFAGSPDLPPRTYDAYLDTTWKPQVSQRLSADLAFRVGVYSDFDNVTSRSVRFPARALGVWSASPNLQFAAGIVYLDRLSVRILPAGGVIWMPNPDTRYELLFPRPKLSQRIWTVRNTDVWGYVAGEYGGNTWTIRRADGSSDLVDYNDLRLILGAEWIGFNRMRANIEAGYVFNRRLEYRSGTPTAIPHDTVMVRAGLAF